MMRPALPLACVLCVFLSPLAAAQDAGPRVELVRHALLGTTDYSQWVRVELDGAAPEEFAGLVGDGTGRALVVMAYGTGNVLRARSVQPLVLEPWDGAVLQRLPGRGQPDRLALLLDDGIRVLSGRDASAAQDLPLADMFNWGTPVVDDMDGDGDPDLVQWTEPYGTIEVRDAGADQQAWSLDVDDTSALAVAQLDTDPALEIILAPQGLVLDGASGAVDWSYAGGFGDMVLVGNLDGDARDEFLAVGTYQATAIAYDGTPFAPTGDFPVDYGLELPSLLDLDGDGRDELWSRGWSDLYGTRMLVVQSVADGAHVREVLLPIAASPNFLVPGRFAGAGVQLLTGGDSWDANPPLMLLDASDGAVLASLPEWPGVPLAIAVDDLRGSGSRELVVLGQDHSYGLQTPLQTWDFPSLQPARSVAKADLGLAYYDALTGFAIGQADGDRAAELVLLGDNFASNVFALDGADLSLEWPADVVESGTLRAVVVDQGRIAVAEQDGGFARVRGLAPGDGSLLWSTVAAPAAWITGLHSGDLDQDGSPDLTLLGTNGAWNYHEGGAFHWSLPVSAHQWLVPAGPPGLLAADADGVGTLASVPEGTALHSWTFTRNVSLLAPLGDGFALVGLADGTLHRLDLATGAREDLGIRVTASIALPWALSPTAHGTEQALLIGSGYGVTELRVLSAEHVFGGSSGGFEQPRTA